MFASAGSYPHVGATEFKQEAHVGDVVDFVYTIFQHIRMKELLLRPMMKMVFVHKYVGMYTVIVTFKGKYSGRKKLRFDIVPKSTSISNLKGDKAKFTAIYKKQAKQTTGYQIEYSTSSKMKKSNSKIIKDNRVSKMIKNFKSVKTYYVRIRTYKTVKYNGKSIKLYSKWSSIKVLRSNDTDKYPKSRVGGT